MTLRDHRTRRASWLLFLLPALWLLGALALPARAQDPETIRLTAKPSTIVADGSSSTTITAEVRDGAGRLVADDQVVRFSTTLGNIESAARTQGGAASVSLTSSTIAGTATVTASSGHATSQAQVTFATQVVGTEESVRSVIIRARYLLYNEYEQTADAVEDVDIRVGGVRIRADRAQVDFLRNAIIAQGQSGAGTLTISAGDVKLSADRVRYNWDSMMGYLSGTTEPLRGLFSFHGVTMTPVRVNGTIAADTFQLQDLVPSPLAIKATRIVYLPGEEIQFTNAEIMLNDKKRVSLPIYVRPVGPAHAGQAQYVGLGPRGPLIDVPYYLLAGEKGSSQLRLKYNAPQGLYGATIAGWALDLLGKYNWNKRADGNVELTRLTSPDWGLTWTHNQQFGPSTRAYLNLDTRAGFGLSHRYSMGNLNLWHQGAGYSLNLTGLAGRFEVTKNADAVLSLSSRARPLPGGFAWSTGLQLAHRWQAVDQTTGTGADAVTRTVTDSSNSEGVNLRVAAPAQRILGARLTASVGPGITYTDGRARQSLIGTVGAYRTLGRNGTFNLTYNYHDYGISSNDATRYTGLDKQTVSAVLTYAKLPRWTASAFATFGLEQNSQNVRLNATYIISDMWHLNVNAGYFKQVLTLRDLTDPTSFQRDTFGVTNVEVRLTRQLGERALALVYESYRNRIYFDYTPGALF